MFVILGGLGSFFESRTEHQNQSEARKCQVYYIIVLVESDLAGKVIGGFRL
jgi:hypothetical protein